MSCNKQQENVETLNMVLGHAHPTTRRALNDLVSAYIKADLDRQRAESETDRLRKWLNTQGEEMTARGKARVACEEENKKLHDANKRLVEANTELCATVQRQLQPTFAYTYTPGMPPPVDPSAENAFLRGRIAGLERAVNALTEVGKGLVNSKSPVPPVVGPQLASIASYGTNQHYYQNGITAGYDRGWNAALAALSATPLESYRESISRGELRNRIESLKKVPC